MDTMIYVCFCKTSDSSEGTNDFSRCYNGTIGWAYTLDDVHVLKEYLLPAYYT